MKISVHRRAVFLFLLSFAAFKAQACDLCGCSGRSLFLGVLPQYQSAFAGVRVHYRTFSSSHPDLDGEPAQSSRERFMTYEAWARFNPLRRLQVYALLPYNVLDQNASLDGRSTSKGFGDLTVLAQYVLLNTSDSVDHAARHFLALGGGIKAPTGSTDFLVGSQASWQSNLQPGTGSWDPMVTGQYVLRLKEWGLGMDASFRYGTTNNRNFRFGNRFSAGARAFRVLGSGLARVLPSAGVQYDLSGRDMENASARMYRPYSGGYFLNGTAGVDVFVRKVGFGVTAMVPIAQRYAGGFTQANAQMLAHVTVFIPSFRRLKS